MWPDLVSADSGRHAGAPHQRAGQGGLGRRRTAARSASAVDAQGQSFEPDVDQFSDLLQAAVGDTTVAIHWDYAREVLQKADGVIATVGLEEDPPAPEPEKVASQ